jgi:uncharacterized protein (TIGR00369 family)
LLGRSRQTYLADVPDEEPVNYGALGAAAINAGDWEAATKASRGLVRLHERMGLTIVSVTDDSAVQTMELSAETSGSGPSSVHGGLLAAFADATAALAVSRSLDSETEIQVTTDMHVRYFRQPRSGPLTATATLVHRGRRILSAECVIRDAEDRDLARATATYMVVPRPF